MTSTGVTSSWRALARRIGPFAAATLLVVPAAACSKTGAPTAHTPTRATASSTAPSTSGDGSTPSPSASTEGKVLENGRVMARRAGVSFAVPAGWQAVDPSRATKAGADAVPEYFASLAKQSGQSVEEFAATLAKTLELMVIGRPANGFAPNISVIPSALLYLPEDASLRSEMESVGATVSRIDHRTTTIGPAVVVRSTLPVGKIDVASRSVLIEHEGHVAIITVSAIEPAEADRIVESILKTVSAL